jgi:hypothetical protein
VKLYCPSCEAVSAMSSFRVEGGALFVRCGLCGVEAALEQATGQPLPRPQAAPAFATVVPLRSSAPEAVRLAREALSHDPFAAPPGRCPKCVGLRPEGAVACAHCGLVFDQLDPQKLAPSPTLEGLWRAALERWDDEAAHAKLTTTALMQGELPAAARLYRIRLSILPDDPFAQRGRDEVVRLASLAPVAASSAREGQERPTPAWKVWAFLGGLFVLVNLVVLFAVKVWGSGR